MKYANGDEALFADASLPRDEYGFRIANGVNTRQQDFRTANSGINMAQFLVLGVDRLQGAGMLDNDHIYFAKFKNKYTKADFPDATSLDGRSTKLLYDEAPDARGVHSLGTPYAKLNKDGYVEIVKSGTYVVQPACSFYRESGTAYTTSNSYQFKEYVRLYSFEDGKRVSKFSSQARACGGIDQISLTYVAWIESGAILTTGVLHTLNSSGTYQNCVIEPALNLYRLS